MIITVLQEEILKALNYTSRFVSPRSQLPILSNVLLVAEKGKLLLGATNLEMGITYQIGASIKEEGKITVPSRVMLELIANLPAGQVFLEVQRDILKITSNSYKAELPGILASEFPSIPNKINNTSFSLSVEVLEQINKQVSFSASQDDSRPFLTGVLFIFTDDVLRAVSTDGFRLSCKEMSFKGLSSDNKSILVPARFLDELYKIVGNSKEKVDIELLEQEKQILASSGQMLLTGRLLEGDYPNFERIIPKNTVYKCIVGRDILARATRAASVFAREASGIIKMMISKDLLSVTAESQKYGHEETTIEAKTEGGDVQVAFNYKYVLDFLSSVKGDEIIFETENATSPGVFKDLKDDNYTHLIMPFKIQD